jgi:hypothetical protein
MRVERHRCPFAAAPFRGSCHFGIVNPEFRWCFTPGFTAPHLRCFDISHLIAFSSPRLRGISHDKEAEL